MTLMLLLLLLLQAPVAAPGIPATERQALLDLYHATGGDAWTNHSGWGGPPGSECEWAGVECWQPRGEGQHVSWIDLPENNIRGAIPDSVALLTGLVSLDLTGNQIAVPLPDALLRRWDKGLEDVKLGGPVEPITKIRLRFSAPLLCADDAAIVIDNTGAISYFRERCRHPKAKDPKPYCELRRGETGEFPRLALFLSSNGFFDVREPETVSVDTGFVTVEVMGPNGIRTVDIYDNEDDSLKVWSYEKVIRGVAENVKWSRPVAAKCPWQR